MKERSGSQSTYNEETTDSPSRLVVHYESHGVLHHIKWKSGLPNAEYQAATL
jgi:hypothetical protein